LTGICLSRISGGHANAAEEDVLHGRVDVHLTAAAAIADAAAVAAAVAAAGAAAAAAAAAAQSCHLSFSNWNHPSNHSYLTRWSIYFIFLSFPFVNISHVFSAVLYVYAC
jgi:hypothetical protein